MNKKTGRPLKYFDNDSRQEAKRIQDRVNQRKHREIKKQLEIINIRNEPNDWNLNYRYNIIKFFSRFEYDYFFTGTVDMKENDQKVLKQINNEIQQLNKYLCADMSYQIGRKISVKSLLRYTGKYVDFLLKNKAIDRCFYVVESGKFNKYHVHMLLKSKYKTDDYIKQFETKWLIGKSLIEPIKNENDIAHVLGYAIKEINPSSKKEIDKIKVDNWFLAGDFSEEKTEQLAITTNKNLN